MSERTILIADDDEISRDLLTRFLQKHGLAVIVAKNGREALDLYARHTPAVVLTDLYMPDLDGRGLVQGLKDSNPQPIILMQTVEQNAATAVELMREGVYDYIVKPIRERELVFRVDKAFEHFESLRLREAVEQERGMRLDRQLNWNVWKESVASRDTDRYDRTLFHNLRVCFTQGAGFGGLVALSELMESIAEKKDGFYMIPEEMMDEIFSNAGTARRTLEEFTELNTILNEDIPLTAIGFEEFYRIMKEITEEVMPLTLLKGHSLKQGAGSVPPGGRLAIHEVYFRRAIRELIINACKYSVAKSEILILYKVTRGKFLITILNKPDATVDVSSPGFDQVIFEPFFRFGNTVDERYGTLDYGLGLTQAEKIIRGHQGRLTASHVRFHLDEGEAFRLNMEVELPILD